MIYVQLLVAGLCGGFLAGLLGIGGGFIVVPVLLLLLPAFGIGPELLPKVAVATSLAVMVPTACSAVYAQYRRGAIDFAWLRKLALGAAIGAAVGAQLAAALNGKWVALIFAVYTGYFAVKMLCDRSPSPAGPGRIARMLSCLPRPLIGLLIGGFSAIAGVGGASLTVPYLQFRSVEMKRAVATSSAVGLAIAVVGALSFAAASTESVTGELIGLVYWPAALILASSAILMAPRGVALSHRLPVRQLKRSFAALLVATCVATLLKVGVPADTDIQLDGFIASLLAPDAELSAVN